MRIHPYVNPDHNEAILKRAKKLGFGKVNFDKYYTITKTGAKNPSPHYPDEGLVRSGDLFLVGTVEDDECHVWLALEQGFRWFKTSPIIKMTKNGKKFNIETENSFYTLGVID